MIKNKIVVLILALVLVLSSCGKSIGEINADTTSVKSDEAKDGKIHIVATTFPQYDWVREIIGEDAENIDLSLLLDSGVDLHSYSPNADDIVEIKNADLFIYVGGHSDKWVDEVVKSSESKAELMSLVASLGDMVKKAEEVEGMEHHHHEDGEHHHEDGEHEHKDGEHHEDGEHEHKDGEHHEDGEHEHKEHNHGDEHVWLSLRNAEILVPEIAAKIAELDPENAEKYKKNAAEYVAKLADLDEKYESIVKDAKTNTLLFADRFPFRYMVDDYDIEYFAAFTGCSAESEASFETIAFLAEKLADLNLPAVITLEGREKKLAETIVETSGKDVEILTLNSMQSITEKQVTDGAKYLDIMEKNAEVLSEALK